MPMHPGSICLAGQPPLLCSCLAFVGAGGDAVCAAKVEVPHCVEPALLVNALVGVGAEEVTLGLRRTKDKAQHVHCEPRPGAARRYFAEFDSIQSTKHSNTGSPVSPGAFVRTRTMQRGMTHQLLVACGDTKADTTVSIVKHTGT